MSCANWILTILSAVVFVLDMWPGLLAGASKWIVAVAAIVMVIVAWTGCECKYCRRMPEAKPGRKK